MLCVCVSGLSHPILGDSSHGSSTCNREWREHRGLPPGRMCLHLARLKLPSSASSPSFDITCPLPHDFLSLLVVHAPGVLKSSLSALRDHAGIELKSDLENNCSGG